MDISEKKSLENNLENSQDKTTSSLEQNIAQYTSDDQSNSGDSISRNDGENFEPLPRLEPFGPGDKEAAFYNNEADQMDQFAKDMGGQKGLDEYIADVKRRMYEPS